MEEKSERSRMGGAYITVMFAMLFLTIISVLLQEEIFPLRGPGGRETAAG